MISMALYVIRHDLTVLMIYLCAWVCATMCMHVLGQQQQQQRSAPDWIKVLLGCGCAPFVKSGFGFEIEAQGEVLCHPQEGQAEWYGSKRVREEQDWRRECLLSRCVISQRADTVISRKTYLSSSLLHQPQLHFHHLCLESNAMSVSVIFFFFSAGQHMPGQKVRPRSRPPFLLCTNLKLQERWRGSSPPISTNQVTFNNRPLHKP